MPVCLLAAVLTVASTAGPIPTASASDPAPITVPTDWGLIPSGLTPGDSFRLLITTSGTTQAVAKPDNSGQDISTYNTFVQGLVNSGHADIQEHSSHFRAVGCTATTSAKDNTYTTGTGEPIYWLDGNKVADNYADFYDGSWDDEADPRNENGAAANASGIHWTGCNDDGTKRMAGNLKNKKATLGSKENINTNTNHKLVGTGQLNTNSNSPLGDSSKLEGKNRTNNYKAFSTSYPMYGLSPVFNIDNTAPVVVSLLSDEEWVLSEDSSISAQMAVSLSRPLIAGERVDAPLVISGVAVGDYTLSASGTGVSATNANTLSPVITFDGAGAQSALISIRPTQDTANEGIAETLTISLGDGTAFDNANGTNVSAGADPHATDKSAKVVIVDSGLWRPVMPSDSGLMPSGVQAGQQFRLIIATSGGTKAESSDIATYNAWVQGLVAKGHAGIRPYASAFTALGSTATTDARDNTHTTGTGVPIYWLNGNKVADDYADFYDKSWDDETNPRNEKGSAVSGTSFWTGSNHNGTKYQFSLGVTVTAKGILNGSGAEQSPLHDSSKQIETNSRLSPMFAISPVFVAGGATEAVAGFASSEFEATEGASGTFDAAYAGSTAAANSSFTVVVTDGTATMGTDFTLASPSTGSAKTLAPTAGASSSTGLALFTPTDDSADAPDRSFTAQIAATSGNLKIGAADQATFTIIDNDPTIVSLSGSGSLTEGSPTTVDLTVTLGRALVDGERIDVPLVVSGTGVDNSDYRLTKKSGTGAKLTGAASNTPVIEFEGGGAETAVLTVAVKDDKADEEETETLTIALGNDAAFDHADLGTTVGGGADPHGTNNSSVITIADNDDPQVNLSRSDSDSLITEGSIATITAKLTETLSEEITVWFVRVADKSEGKSADYTLPFWVKIPAGSLSNTANFFAVDDNDDEPAETVRIAIGDKTTGVDKGVNRYVDITINDNDPTEVSLTGGGTVEEGSTDTAEITVTLGRELEDGYEVVKVPLAISGTGITSADFTLELKTGQGINHQVTLDNAAPLAPTVRFNRGAQTAVLLLSAQSDDNNEGTSETLAIALGTQTAFDDLIGTSGTTVNGGAAPHSTNNSASVTIDEAPLAGVSVSKGAVSVAENGSTDTYTVVLDSEPASSVTVTATSAAPGAAKVHASGGSPAASVALTFTTSNWSQAQTITVTGQNDNVDNTGDQRTAAISHAVTTGDGGDYPTSLTIAPVTATVTDDDAAPTGITLSASPTTVAEDAGNTTVTVTARVNGTTRYADAKTVTVSVAGHNTNGKVAFTQVNDFDITIAAGQASQTNTFTLTPTDDASDTANGQANITGAISGENTPITGTTIAITDNDATPTAITLSVDDNSVAEGDSAQTITVTATVDGSTRFGVAKTVTVSVAGEADTSSVNYVDSAAVGDFNIVIPAGAASHTNSFTLTPSDDIIDETDNTVTVSGSITGDSAVTVNSATITLSDDDATPTGVTLSVDNNSVSEGDAATTITVTATVNGSTRFGLPKTVAVSVAGHDASNKVQFAAVSDFNIVIATGAASNTGQFSLTPTDDAKATADGEASVTGTVTGDGSVTVTATSVTVANDDQAPAAIAATLGVNNSGSVTEGSTLTVTVSLGSNAATNLSVPVRMSTSGSPTASSGDFTLSNSGSVAITSGTNSGTITFTAVDDEIDEDSESLTLEFGSLPAELSAGSPDTAAVTITDNDTAGVTVTETGTPTNTTVEENEGEDTYTVVLDSEPLKRVKIRVAIGTIGGSIAARVEKNENGSFATYQDLTFTPSNWNQPKTITVRGANNNIDDPGDKRTVTITHTVTEGDNGKYTTSTSISDVTVTVTDDDLGAKPRVTLSINGGGGATEGGARTITATLDQVLSPAAVVTIPIRRGSGSSASASDYSLASSITIASGSRTGSTTLSTSNDSADEPTETLLIQLGTLPSTVVAGSTTSVTATIYDNDPTAVSLARSGTGTISETSGKAVITVSLGRSLLSSERIDVPLRISGTGITAADYTLSLRSGSNLNTGVSLRSANTTSPVLRFSGRGARTATLDLAATDDKVDEGASETLTIALGSNSAFDRQTSTNVGGGADPHRTVNRTLIVINDDDQTASAQSDESDEISGSNPLVVSVGAASPTSVDEGHSTLIPISMNKKSSTPMAITISVIGNADPNTDFTVALSDPDNPGQWQRLSPRSGLINIVLNPGDTYSTLQLNALADDQPENPEGVLVSISALEAIGGSDRKAITVGAASVAIYDPGTRPEPSSRSLPTGQSCYDIFGFGYGDWYSPDRQSCVLVNYFPNTHPAHGNAVKAWIQEHPDQYQQYLDQTSTGSQTTSQAPNSTQPVAQLLAAGQSCYDIFGFGYGDWYSPDRQSCVLVNYFPNTHPAHGNAVKAWIQEHPDQYQQYLDQTS